MLLMTADLNSTSCESLDTYLLCDASFVRAKAKARELRLPLQAGYVTCGSLLDAQTTAFLNAYTLGCARRGTMTVNDGQVLGAHSQYGDPVTELLLDRLREFVEQASGLPLFPTYSYMRVYKHGDVLPAHTDRAACEISVTLAVGVQPSDPWPIQVETATGASSVVLRPGDAMIYRAIEHVHWRNTFRGRYAVQVFLHYVDKHGPYARHRYDGRARLNYPCRLQTRSTYPE